MFLHFTTQEKRKAYGGSAFLEFQYCKMKFGTPENEIVDVCSVSNWQNDSIYVYFDDIDDFYKNYASIFTNGLYNNMDRGKIDICGINYYSAMQVSAITQAIEVKKPMEYARLLRWLRNSSPYNGVYLLGI